MNFQEFFDKAYLGILKQGVQSVVNRKCSYITKEGNRCAIEILLKSSSKQINSYPILGSK